MFLDTLGRAVRTSPADPANPVKYCIWRTFQFQDQIYVLLPSSGQNESLT